MIDLTKFLGTTSTLATPLQYSFNGTPQPNSSAVFLAILPNTLTLHGRLTLGDVHINGSLSLSLFPGGHEGKIVYSSGDGIMMQTVKPSVSGNVLTLTPTDSSQHGSPIDEVLEFFEKALDAATHYTIQPVPGTGSETNTQLFADVGGLKATTVLVPAK